MEIFSKAQRIWSADADGTNVYADFFAEFPRADRITLACDGNYALYINGDFVAHGQFPGYEDLTFCDTIDIGQYAQKDANQLKIVAHHPGVDTSTYRNKPAFVIFEVYCGEATVCSSCEKTLTAVDPNYEHGAYVGMVSGQLGFTFGYNAQEVPAKCTNAIPVDGTTEYLPRPVGKLVVGEPKNGAVTNWGVFTDRLKDGTPAQKMTAAALENRWLCGGKKLPDADGIELSANSGDGIFAIVDLGEEDTGFLSIDVNVPRECDIFIGWGEHLADLRVRTSIGGRNFAARYHAKAGRNRFENPLLRCGCRFVELHIYAESCRIFYAGIRPTRYPLPTAKPCPWDDSLHRRIYDTCVRTLELCMHEHYEDCPWREQALYTMDSRNQMLCGYYIWNETIFAKASLELIAHSLREDGLLELCSPARVGITIPSFSAIFIVQLDEYFVHSDDSETVKKLLPIAEKIAEMFEKRLADGLIGCFEDGKYWNFYEWQEGLDDSRQRNGHSFDAPLSAFVSMAFSALADIRRRLGLDHRHFDELRERVNLAAENFWDEEHGTYASYIVDGEKSHFCELTNSLLLYCGAVPENRRQRVISALKSGELTPVTLSHSIFKYDALLSEHENVNYVLKDIEEKWGGMLMNGATTFWETIEGQSAFGNAGSLCHGWSAIPAYIYFRIAGN